MIMHTNSLTLRSMDNFFFFLRKRKSLAFLCIEKGDSTASEEEVTARLHVGLVDIPGWGQSYPKPFVPSPSPAPNLLLNPI